MSDTLSFSPISSISSKTQLLSMLALEGSMGSMVRAYGYLGKVSIICDPSHVGLKAVVSVIRSDQIVTGLLC